MLLLICHVGMRNMSLAIEGKSVLLISSRKVVKLFFSTWWKIELVSIGFRCLVEEIFQQSVKKKMTCFLLVAYGKMLEARNQLRKKLSSKKGIRTWWFGNFKCNILLENTKQNEKLPVWTEGSKERVKWKKALGLPRSHRQQMKWQGYLPVHSCSSSGGGKGGGYKVRWGFRFRISAGMG